MPDGQEEVKDEVTTTPFSPDAWKTEPTVIEPITEEVKDPAIVEKDEKIKEDKLESAKPDEPEKIPAASPKPIQDRPEETKEDIKPVTELKFANEESEKIYNLLQTGDADKALEVYAEQKKLKEADKLPPAEAIKLNLQYQNKDFTPTEIQDLFEETYSFPEKPVQGELEDEDEFKIREDKYNASVEKVNRRIERDAKPATAELLKLSKEIVLPDIKRENPKPAEPTQEELEATAKAMDIFFEDLNEGAKSFTGYNTTFKDEEVEIKVSVPVTQQEKEALSPILKNVYTDMAAFFEQLGWADKDGKVTGKLVEDVHLITNKETVLSKLSSEVGNKRFAEAKKSIKNIDYGDKPQSNGDLGQTPQEKERAMVTHFFSR